jgi:hypothetical protein
MALSVTSAPALSTRAAAATRADASQFSATPGHDAGCRCCGGKNFKIPRKEWTKKLL